MGYSLYCSYEMHIESAESSWNNVYGSLKTDLYLFSCQQLIYLELTEHLISCRRDIAALLCSIQVHTYIFLVVCVYIWSLCCKILFCDQSCDKGKFVANYCSQET